MTRRPGRRAGARWPALVLLLAAALLLPACAAFNDPGRIATGIPQAEVLRQLGQPSAVYPAAGSSVGARLQYSYQPFGQRVFNLDLDGQGRLMRSEQALSETLFEQRIQANHWTRQDVLREYGPPAMVTGTHGFDGEVWVWRYLQGPFWRLLYIDIDRGGIVRSWATGDEILPDPPDKT